MKLYDLKYNDKFTIIDTEVRVPPATDWFDKDDVFTYYGVDGMYAKCQNSKNERVFLAAWTEVEIYLDKPVNM